MRRWCVQVASDAVEQPAAGIREMALPTEAPEMRDQGIAVVVSLVSALSLQSSREEDGDGALRWCGHARGELYAGRDVGFWAAIAVVGGRDEWERADRGGASDSGAAASLPGGGNTERLVVRASEAARGGDRGDGCTGAKGAEGRPAGRL